MGELTLAAVKLMDPALASIAILGGLFLRRWLMLLLLSLALSFLYQLALGDLQPHMMLAAMLAVLAAGSIGYAARVVTRANPAMSIVGAAALIAGSVTLFNAAASSELGSLAAQNAVRMTNPVDPLEELYESGLVRPPITMDGDRYMRRIALLKGRGSPYDILGTAFRSGGNLTASLLRSLERKRESGPSDPDWDPGTWLDRNPDDVPTYAGRMFMLTGNQTEADYLLSDLYGQIRGQELVAAMAGFRTYVPFPFSPPVTTGEVYPPQRRKTGVAAPVTCPESDELCRAIRPAFGNGSPLASP